MMHILVAVDFSPSSEKAVTVSVEMARKMDAHVLLLYVLNTTDLRYALQEGLQEDFESSEEVRTKVQEHIRHRFEELISAAGQDYEKIATRTERGEPWREITQVARTLPADFIVAGARGLSKAKELILGSTSQELIRAAPCPVVTVRN